MSRVTIGDITEDLLPFTEKGNKVIMVEIVPRKIVEDIIQFCVEDISVFDKRLEQSRISEIRRQKILAEREYAYQLMCFAQGKLLEFEGVSE